MDHRQRRLEPEDLRFVPPELPLAELRSLAGCEYGLEGEFEALTGERDQNLRITTAEGAQYLLKVAGALEDPGITDFQIQALLHLERAAPDLPVPRLIRSREGATHVRIDSATGETHLARMLTYLPGIPYRDGARPSSDALREIGRFQGRLTTALSDFAHPHARHFMPWDVSNGLVLNHSLWDRFGGDISELRDSYLPHVEESVFPALSKLRRQVIHNDAHAENVLRADSTSETITGLIDFGDMVDAPLIADLAISIASFIEGFEDPAAVAAAMTSGFDAACALEADELGLLYDVVLVRLVLDVLLSGMRYEAGDDFLAPYLRISVRDIHAMLAVGRERFTRRVHSALDSSRVH